ncbi:hypothetical protein CYY_005119 [Polysphondylium violaceum]|uniref:Myotubularin phosphatase domain-containing protein n=1 Tax=Polysphondylium violaceum TaxID=133409 RepID=A0A8J4PTY6_9MYCE|nr:hypothetical protein CYY_005119 [Polysphondylium violaceum]
MGLQSILNDKDTLSTSSPVQSALSVNENTTECIDKERDPLASLETTPITPTTPTPIIPITPTTPTPTTTTTTTPPPILKKTESSNTANSNNNNTTPIINANQNRPEDEFYKLYLDYQKIHYHNSNKFGGILDFNTKINYSNTGYNNNSNSNSNNNSNSNSLSSLLSTSLNDQQSNASIELTIMIHISPWLNEDPQELTLKDQRAINIGDINVFFKEKGTFIKIKNLHNYYLYKNLSNSTVKKKLLMSNDQPLSTYNIKNYDDLYLLQVKSNSNNSNNSSNNSSNTSTNPLPRWFYKVIVPSIQLEGILKELNSKTNNEKSNNNNNNLLHFSTPPPHYHRRHNSKDDPFQILSSSANSNSNTTSTSLSKKNNSGGTSAYDIIENIKSKKLVTIDSPSRNNNNTTTNNNNTNNGLPIKTTQQQWSYATPSSVPPHHAWLHARRVFDVVNKIESEFPYISDPRLDSIEEDKWEARINSSDDSFIKTLSMEDSLGSELIKQEYIEFSLRHENRSALLIGIEYSFVVWIDPIQSFFTLSFSSNTTVRDAVYFILQYLFPSNNSNNNNKSNSKSSITNKDNDDIDMDMETFLLMLPHYGLYLQDSSTVKLIPLQHKQLLSNQRSSHQSMLVFKRKKYRVNTNDLNNYRKKRQSFHTVSNLSISGEIVTSNNGQSSSSPRPSIEEFEDEGYNLTVLFPTKQTYRQFHFIPTHTVNETIQMIVSAIAPPPSLRFGNNNNNSSGSAEDFALNDEDSQHLSEFEHLGGAPTYQVDNNQPLFQPQSTVSLPSSPIALSRKNHLEFRNVQLNSYSPAIHSPILSTLNHHVNNQDPSSSNSEDGQQQQQLSSSSSCSSLSSSSFSMPISGGNGMMSTRNYIFETNEETSGFCLYFQKSGSGVWMEGNRTLISYNLPNETVVEFKPPPTISKLSLIEGVNHTIKLLCKSLIYTLVYCKFTQILSLEDLISKKISSLSKKEAESFGLFLVRDEPNGSHLEICLSSYPTFKDLDIEILPTDILQFKESTATTIDSVAALTFGAPKDPPLISGETIVMKRDGQRLVSDQLKKGVFILTNYRLMFNALNRSSYVDLTKEDCDIPLSSILKVKNTNGNTEIQCKDFRVCTFNCNDSNLWHNLKSMVDTNSIQKTFAFKNLEQFDKKYDTIYNLWDEFERLQFPLDGWRVTHVNEDYSLCPTYPSKFIVPKNILDTDLKKISMFREKGRVPAICWIHKNHKSTITRCSQPRVGLRGARCAEDEEYLKSITESNSNSTVLYVMDSRPMANAKANTLLGKGHENTALYQNVELQFLGIGNIHVMRDSFKKLYSLSQNLEASNWLSILDDTAWLEHIYQLINSAHMVVELVDKKGTSVLTHCSDGWDRTSQLVSLSQLLLDPYYRTIKGFQILIEKEWLSFGHLFATRCNHINSLNEDDFSPIFLLFIDAVWQLTCLLPTTFEFNETFLIKILDSVYNCRYKTFLFNSEKEKNQNLKSHPNLVSLWCAINSNIEPYVNCFYIMNSKPIFENFFIGDIQFWSNYYLRWNEKYRPKLSINSSILQEIDRKKKKQPLSSPSF